VKKILVVSKDDVSLRRERNVLNRSDIKVLTVISCKEALDIHKTENVDLIIIDLDMPEMSGEEFCSVIRAEEKLKSVSILIVCKNEPFDLERVSGSKANAFVTKPIVSSEFLQKVSRLLDVPLRKSLRVLLKVTARGKCDLESFYCHSKDISSSGILIETRKIIPEDEKITLSFFLTKSFRIITAGKIYRVAKKSFNLCQYGIKFTNLTGEQQSAIEAFIKQRSADSGN
jgi:CheY-like chemotaxis protein